MEGRGTIVLDPLSSNWGNAQTVSSVQELIDAAKIAPNKLLVVDESALSLDRYNASELWLAKTARHNGHSSIFIGQDWIDVPKGIRSQCEQIFIFCCMKDEAKELANRYGDDLLMTAWQQKQFEFIVVKLNEGIKRGRVDIKSKRILLQST